MNLNENLQKLMSGMEWLITKCMGLFSSPERLCIHNHLVTCMTSTYCHNCNRMITMMEHHHIGHYTSVHSWTTQPVTGVVSVAILLSLQIWQISQSHKMLILWRILEKNGNNFLNSLNQQQVHSVLHTSEQCCIHTAHNETKILVHSWLSLLLITAWC
jgi:hypothetical protein